MTPADLPPVLTRRDVAKVLQVSLRYVDKLVAKQGLPVYRLGGTSVRIDRDAFIAWHEAQQKKQEPQER
jgi:excisionase family DNA binding protein